jgi:hypothetical protein
MVQCMLVMVMQKGLMWAGIVLARRIALGIACLGEQPALGTCP